MAVIIARRDERGIALLLLVVIVSCGLCCNCRRCSNPRILLDSYTCPYLGTCVRVKGVTGIPHERDKVTEGIEHMIATYRKAGITRADGRASIKAATRNAIPVGWGTPKGEGTPDQRRG